MSHTALLDTQAFDRQVRGGISRYFAELYRHRAGLGPDLELHIGQSWTINEHLAAANRGIRRVGEIRLSRFEITKALARPFAHRAPSHWRDADLLHHTYYNLGAITSTPGKTRVSTIFDMIPEEYPETVKSGAHQDKAECLRRSDVICAISRTTADSLIRLWPEFADKQVVVTPLGVGSQFHPDGPTFPHPFPYILWVGDRRGYKNFATLAKALDLVAGELPRTDLVIVGGAPLTRAEALLLGRFQTGGEVVQIWPTDSELPGVYRGARLYVTASLVEGFGLSGLEALACGAVTLASDIPVYREVLGDAVAWFNPVDPHALAEAIGDLLQDGVASQQDMVLQWSESCERLRLGEDRRRLRVRPTGVPSRMPGHETASWNCAPLVESRRSRKVVGMTR